MRFYDVERRWTLPEDDPVVASQQITDIVLEVDSSGGAGQERLVVSFHHDVSLEYREDGRPVGTDIAKEITYQLAPVSDPDGPGWLLAGFDGESVVVDWSRLRAGRDRSERARLAQGVHRVRQVGERRLA